MQTNSHFFFFLTSILFSLSLLQASVCSDQKLNLSTVKNSETGFDFIKATFSHLSSESGGHALSPEEFTNATCLEIGRTSYHKPETTAPH